MNKLVKPRHRSVHHPTTTAIRKAREGKSSQSKQRPWRIDYEMLAAKVMGIAPQLGEQFTVATIERKLGLSHTAAHKVTTKLLKAGKFKAKGHSAARRLSLP